MDINIQKNYKDLYLSGFGHIFISPFTAEFPIVLNVFIMRSHVKLV